MITERFEKRNEGGFTLIELAVALVITVLISLVVLKFWLNSSEAFALDSNVVTIKQQSERAMEIMTERIRRATATSIALSNGNSAIDFVDSSDGSNVRYELIPLAPAAPVWGQIAQTVNGTQSTIAGYAESLRFSVTGTGLVNISASFHKGTGRAETRLAVQSSVAARN